MKKYIALMLALLLCIGMLAGCAKDDPVEDPGKDQPNQDQPVDPKPDDPKPVDPQPVVPAEPKIYHSVSSSNADSLSPMQAGTSGNSDMIGYLSGQLYTVLPGEDRISCYYGPELAAELPIDKNGDGKTWTIKLNKDAKWSNGEAINADTWIFTWKSEMDPKLANSYAVNIYKNYMEIVGGAEYFAQTAEAPVSWDTVGIKKIDEYTLEVTCKNAVTQTEAARQFATAYTSPVYEPLYTKCMNADGTANDYGTTAEKFMCSGPFVLDTWVKGAQTILSKNPLWTLADRIKLDGLTIREVSDESTRLELFEKGESDSVGLGTNGLAKYGEDPRVISQPTVTIRSIEFNQNNPEKPYLSDPIYRKAIFYACDRVALSKLTNTIPANYFLSSLDIGLPSSGILYRDTDGAKANLAPNYGYDPTLAKQYFDEILKKYNLQKISLNLIYNETVEAARLMSEYLMDSWAKIFGADKFEISLTAMPTSSALKVMRASQNDPVTNWDMCWSHWGLSGEPDYPEKKFSKYTSMDSTRYTHYTSEKLNDLYTQMMDPANRFNEQKMLQLYTEAEKVVLDEMLVCPVVQTQSFTMKAERIIFPVDKYVQGIGYGTIYCDIKQ